MLLNGTPTMKGLHARHGLRHGDLLISFLFILAMEGLHMAIEGVLATVLFHEATVGSDRLQIIHLFYADNVVFLGDLSRNNIINITNIIQCFHTVSGSQICNVMIFTYFFIYF